MPKDSSLIKKELHPNNIYNKNYDFDSLVLLNPSLKKFVFENEYQTKTLDFSNPTAVKTLNQTLLLKDFDIKSWDIPDGFLCPAIPGRLDYVLYLADLLAKDNNQNIPKNDTVIGLDIGIGANCIYPILGQRLFNWQFVGTDIDDFALENCQKIIEKNPNLIDFVSLQQQTDSRFLFKNIIEKSDKFSFTICNPPFHASAEDAANATSRKTANLFGSKNTTLNFGGQNSELWTAGGELAFITQMIYESRNYPLQVLWFTTLVSKKENLTSLYKTLNKVEAVKIETINMAQGNKISRILVWTFQTDKQRNEWKF
jgi:23S rRNA (adenine1618-N6)-methyltransferase